MNNEYNTNSLFQIEQIACKVYRKEQLGAQIVIKNK